MTTVDCFCVLIVDEFQFVGICFFERLPLAIGYFDSLRDAPPHGQCVPGAVVIVTRSLSSVTLLRFKFQLCIRIRKLLRSNGF